MDPMTAINRQAGQGLYLLFINLIFQISMNYTLSLYVEDIHHIMRLYLR